MREVSIKTQDGWVLAGLLYEPDGPVADVIVLNGATGVPRNFYKSFAKWCADERQSACLIYDYRDFGFSRINEVKDSPVCMTDWAIKDQQAAIQFMLDRYPNNKVSLIGHSLGGMFLQYQSEKFGSQIKLAITVASGSGYWLQHPLWYIPVVSMFWWVVGPVSTKLLGYTPGRALGFGSDLPAGVYWQWRRWCTSRRFYDVDRPAHLAMCDEKIVFPVSMFTFSDDQMIPRQAVEFLQNFYDSPDVTVTSLEPRTFGLKKIGHIHSFAKRNKAAWPAFFE